MGQSSTSLIYGPDDSLKRTAHHHRYYHSSKSKSKHPIRNLTSTSMNEEFWAAPESTPRTRTSTQQKEKARRHQDQKPKPPRELDGNTRQAAASGWDRDGEIRDASTKPENDRANSDKPARRHRGSKADVQRPRKTGDSTEKQTRPQATDPPPYAFSSHKHRHSSKATSRSGVKVSATSTKPRREESKKDCMVCVETLSLSRFPQRAITSQCTHEVNTCRHCLRSWIRSEFEAKMWNQINCPECMERMQYEDVKAWAPRRVFRRYDGFSTRAALEAIPGFRWCIVKGCKSGQVHDEGNMTPKLRCIGCKTRQCVVHGVAWHKGETCSQYDYRTDGKIRKAEERASRKLIRELAKKCPGCKWNIEKNEGCDHMTCSKCRHEFCWLCLAPWAPIRNQGGRNHQPTCILYVGAQQEWFI